MRANLAAAFIGVNRLTVSTRVVFMLSWHFEFSSSSVIIIIIIIVIVVVVDIVVLLVLLKLRLIN